MLRKSKGSRIVRRIRRVKDGILEGLVGPYAMPTFYRLQNENGIRENGYKDAGFLTGIAINSIAYWIALSKTDYNPLVFAPLIAANIISLGYEKIRKHLKNKS